MVAGPDKPRVNPMYNGVRVDPSLVYEMDGCADCNLPDKPCKRHMGIMQQAFNAHMAMIGNTPLIGNINRAVGEVLR